LTKNNDSHVIHRSCEKSLTKAPKSDFIEEELSIYQNFQYFAKYFD